MAREIWKLGKFHKGINSHTDPKDISSEEWVTLDDVNVSKVGVAKAIGQPETNLTVNPLEVEGSLIPGKGFYRFNSDNSYVSQLAHNSFHNLVNTSAAGSGESSTATFGINSVVWVFNAKPTAITSMKFKLSVGGSPIMADLVCLNGTLPQSTSGTDLTGSNNVFNKVVGDVTSYTHWHSVGIGGATTTEGAKFTAIPHNVIDLSTEAANSYASIPGPHDVLAGLFWNPAEGEAASNGYLTNLNNPNLLFSATYDSDGYPNGTLDFNTHYMLGIYNWIGGYQAGTEDEEGNAISNAAAYYSQIVTVPFDGPWNNSAPIQQNSKKAMLSFQKAVIDKINSFGGSHGGGTGTDFSAVFNSSGTVLSSTTNGYDEIRINSTQDFGMSGAITADLTSSSVTGAAQIADGSVTLLSSADSIGQGAGQGSTEGMTSSSWQDYYVSNGLTLRGNTEVLVGSADSSEVWVLTIRGNPNSQEIMYLETTDTGTQITDNIITLQANHASNQAFAEELRDLYNTASTGATAASAADTSFTDDIYTAWKVTITSDSVGAQEYFSIQIHWADEDGNLMTASGTDDEQLALVYKTNESLAGPDITIYKTGLKIFSTVAMSWTSFFNNNDLTDLANRDVSKYLDWFYTENNDNDPIFWDEGSMLRIADTNFDLLRELDNINYNEVFQDSNGFPKDNNPTQWIGFKDLRYHFAGKFDYLSADFGVFIGKSAKIWEYSSPLAYGSAGSGVDEDASETLTNNYDFGTSHAGLRFHFDKGTTNGIDWVGTIKIYAAACYDDGSESLPAHYFSSTDTGDFGDADSTNTLKFNLVFRPEDDQYRKLFSDVRIDGIRLYYTHSEEGHSTFWDLGKLDFNRGFIKSTTLDTVDNTVGNEDIYEWALGTNIHSSIQTGNITVYNGSTTFIEYFEMPKSRTFEDINGYSATANMLHVDYRAVCIAGRRTFVGNLRVWNGSYFEYYNDRMVVSPVNSLDTFPYPDNILELDVSDGDKIVALASYGDKVMQFKEKILYIVNISTGIASEFYVEERLKWRGVINRNHICTTDEGIFWINERGAWIYDGDDAKDLFVNEELEVSQQRIGAEEWRDFISDDTIVGYNALSREVVIAKTHTPSTDTDGDCFIYNLVVDSFTKGKKKFYVEDNKSMTNIQSNGSLGKISYLIEQSPAVGLTRSGKEIH